MRDFKVGDTLKWVGGEGFQDKDTQKYFAWFYNAGRHELFVGDVCTVTEAEELNFSVFVWRHRLHAKMFSQPTPLDSRRYGLSPWVLATEETENA